jgi:hypothetical protein
MAKVGTEGFPSGTLISSMIMLKKKTKSYSSPGANLASQHNHLVCSIVPKSVDDSFANAAGSSNDCDDHHGVCFGRRCVDRVSCYFTEFEL